MLHKMCMYIFIYYNLFYLYLGTLNNLKICTCILNLYSKVSKVLIYLCIYGNKLQLTSVVFVHCYLICCKIIII